MKELIIANSVLILGYLFYAGYLTKYGSTVLNRYFLLLWILVSALVAVLPINFISLTVAQQFTYTYTLPTFVVTPSIFSTYDTTNWLLIVYVLFSSLFAIRVLYQLVTVIAIIKRSTQVLVNGQEYLSSSEVEMPFSFFSYVVIPTSAKTDEIPIIVEHELAHVRAKHSFDILLIQIIQSLCWFNPVVWIYEKSIRINHEYEADMAVLKAHYNEARYKELLVAKAMATHVNIGHAMASRSQLRKRFIKMKTSKKNSVWHYGFLLPLLVIVMVVKSCISEEHTEIKPAIEQLQSTEKEVVKDFSELEVLPEFPGGEQAFYSFLGSELQYPSQAKSEGIEGVVYTKFVISETGKISSVEILRSPNDELSEEAIRVVSSMPNWKPAVKDGKEVSAQYTIPIRFALDGE